MRTTITFEGDVAAAIAQLRREEGLGVSGAVNELIRRGLSGRPQLLRFEQRTSPGHARIDVTDIAEVLELIEGPTAL